MFSLIISTIFYILLQKPPNFFVLEDIPIGKMQLNRRKQTKMYNKNLNKWKMKEMKEPVFFQPDPSFESLEYTYAFSKYSCVSWVYPFHIVFAYLVALSGLFALLGRVIPKLAPYHAMFGRWYLIFMLWCMATSLLIHNAGLPMPIIVSFIYLLVSITVGWNTIKLHTSKIAEQVREKVNFKINELIGKNYSDKPLDVKELEDEARKSILIQKTFFQRFFSLRMLHGIFMTFSWAQMVGRIFVTNPFSSWNGCWSYPAYKSLNMGSTVHAVDSVSTPPFPMKEGVFIAVITVPTIAIILTVACLTTFCYFRSDTKVKDISPNPSENMVQ